MSELTPNLKLFKYNTETDAKQPFSINDCMNANWDKLDANLIGADKIEEQLADKVDTSNTQWATNACMPDYSTGVAITSGWIAPYDCFGYCAGKQADKTSCYVYVNGVEVFGYITGAYPKFISGNFLVPKGSTVTFKGNFGTAPKVYKLKGVN